MMNWGAVVVRNEAIQFDYELRITNRKLIK